MGSEEMDGSEMTFLVVLFGAGGGADGRLAILGMPVDETTSPLVSLGSGTIGAAAAGGVFVALTDFADLAVTDVFLATADFGVVFLAAAGGGILGEGALVTLGAGVAFLAGAFEALFTTAFLAVTTGFLTGALAAVAGFFTAGLVAGF